jgi:serine/threonine protein kinase
VALQSRKYSVKSDVYSFGVVLFEIFSRGATPYTELTAGEVGAAVLRGHRLARPSPFTPEAICVLMRDSTTIEVAARPSMASVVLRLQALLGESGKDDRSPPAAARSLFQTELVAEGAPVAGDSGPSLGHDGVSPKASGGISAPMGPMISGRPPNNSQCGESGQSALLLRGFQDGSGISTGASVVRFSAPGLEKDEEEEEETSL